MTFLIFGLAMLEKDRTIAWTFLALATLRLVLWLRTAARVMARRSKEMADRPPPPEPRPGPGRLCMPSD